MLAASELHRSIEFADMFVVARQIEEDGVVSTKSLSRVVGMPAEVVEGGYCRSDIILAATTIVLTQIDTSNQTSDYEGWLSAVTMAEKFLQHALSCMPTDSNLWLRLAVVRAVIAEDPQATAQLMAQSVKLAPADQVTLLARLYFWNRFSEATLRSSSPMVEQDLDVLFQLGDPLQIAQRIPNVEPALIPYIKRASISLSDSRKKLFARSGLDIAKLP
ncbi:hypothetical protein ACK9YZ_26095 [Rhizobium sp. ZK1]|uniref:hypothetical protein n=1 Tax=Rhizobium sp. ZK1 TaxID=3389872 RepID=UPI0039F6612D